jgi:hypothetical protein
MVEVDVLGGDDDVLVIVLDVGEPAREPTLVVVIDEGDGARPPPGRSPPPVSPAPADEVAQCL